MAKDAYFENSTPFQPGTVIKSSEMNAKLDLIAGGFTEAKAEHDYLRVEADNTKILAESISKRLEGDGSTSSFEAVVSRLTIAESELEGRARASDLLTVKTRVDGLGTQANAMVQRLSAAESEISGKAKATDLTTVNTKVESQKLILDSAVTRLSKAESDLNGKSNASDMVDVKASLQDKATKNDLSAVVNRISTAEADIKGKASATDQIALAAKVNNPAAGLDSKASITDLSSVSAELSGKASASSLTALDAKVVANANTVTAQVARLDQAVSDANTAAARSSSNLSAKIAAGQSGNLLINADFLFASASADPLSAWTTLGGAANLVIGQSLGGAWQVVPDTAAKVPYLHHTAGAATTSQALIYQNVAAEPGKTYCFSFYSGVHRARGWASLVFYDAANVLIGSAPFGPEAYNEWNSDAGQNKWGGTSLDGYKRVYLVRKAPANAAVVSVAIFKGPTLPSYNDSWHFFTRAMLEVVTEGVTEPSNWRAGQTAVAGINASLSAQIARLDSVVVDVSGKASTSSVQEISASVGQQNASITQLSQAQASTDGKLMAKWGVVISGQTADGRKKLSGLQSFNDGTTSNFVITADQVSIGDLSNLVSDPNYMDMSWWGRSANNPIEDGGAPGWAKTARRLTITPAFNGESISKSFPVTPGAVYRLEVVVYNNNAVGSLKVLLHIPGIRWAGFDGSWSDAPTIVADGSSAGARWFTSEVTFPVNAFFSTSNIRIVSNISSGSFVVGLVSVVRVSDSTLIAGGAITAEKIKVDSLQAVTARTGNLIVDGGGSICSGGFINSWSWPAAGQTGFHLSGRGLLMGSPNYANGAFFHYDVTTGSLILNNGTISASTINAATMNGGVVNSATINAATMNGGVVNAATMNGGVINGAQINVKSADSGQRVELTNSLLTVFDANGVALVQLGIF